jgi:hypothetical protein
MARLTAAKRKKLPKKDFGLPAKKGKGGENKAGKGGYPMPDKTHARIAKAYASKEEHAGKLSKSAEKKIDAKADRKLGESGGKKKKSVKERLKGVKF